MSHKVTTFAVGCPLPQTSDRFIVFIPGILNSPLRVSATTLPQQTRSVVNVAVSAQPVYIPGPSQVSGMWSCVITESALLDVNISISVLKRRVRSRTGRVVSYDLINPIVFLTDAATGLVPISWVQIENAWIESVDPISLDWSRPDEPLKWRVNFRYSSLKKFPINDENTEIAYSVGAGNLTEV